MVALTSLRSGDQGIVTALRTQNETIVNKLFAMGISPGVVCELEQRFPVFIVKVGRLAGGDAMQTRAALDRDIASLIEIELSLPAAP